MIRCRRKAFRLLQRTMWSVCYDQQLRTALRRANSL
jgi:hypothetical protein